MLRALLVVLALSEVSAFIAQGPMPLHSARSVSPTCQFGTGKCVSHSQTSKPANVFADGCFCLHSYEKGDDNFFLSPVAGGSSKYPYGEYELDTSGALPATFLAALSGIVLPLT